MKELYFENNLLTTSALDRIIRCQQLMRNSRQHAVAQPKSANHGCLVK